MSVSVRELRVQWPDMGGPRGECCPDDKTLPCLSLVLTVTLVEVSLINNVLLRASHQSKFNVHSLFYIWCYIIYDYQTDVWASDDIIFYETLFSSPKFKLGFCGWIWLLIFEVILTPRMTSENHYNFLCQYKAQFTGKHFNFKSFITSCIENWT